MKVNIGIDPSINSTGICILGFDNDELVYEQLYIVTNKITKEQQTLSDKYPYMKYVLYDKHESTKNDNTYTKELNKSLSLISISQKINDILNDNFSDSDDVSIVMEGVSFGSTKTLALADLAGLSYLIRSVILSHKNVHLFVTPPTEIKKFASGFGLAKKDIMVEMFKGTHKGFVLPKMDDIADAYFMCRYCKYVGNK